MKHRKQAKTRKHRPPKHAKKSGIKVPRTADEFFAKPERFRDNWIRATGVVSKMRADGISLRRASQDVAISPSTVIRLAGSALRKRRNGRYAAKGHDRLLRVLVIPTPDGLREVATRDSREASKAAEYWNAVHRYLSSPGDSSAVRKFKGQQIRDASGKRIVLLSDLTELDRQGNAGNLSFESIYAKR